MPLEFVADPKVRLPSATIGGALSLAKSMPDLEYVMTPVFVQGQLITLTAHPGHGKSTVSAAVAFALTLSQPLGTMRPTLPGLVYFVSAEDVEGTRRRIFAEAAHRRLADTDRARLDRNLRWVHLDGAPATPLIAAEIEADCGEHPVRMVILDTGPALFAGESENDNTEMQSFAFACRRFTELPGSPCTVILWHPAKGATADNLVPRGGSALLGAVDGNLTLWHDHERGIATLARSPWKWRGEHFEPLTFRFETVELVLPSGRAASIKLAIPDNDVTPAIAPKPIRRDVALDALREVIAEYGERMPGSSTIPKGVKAVRLDQWRERWALRTGYTDSTIDSIRANFNKDREKLLRSGAINISAPYVWTL